MAIAQAMSLSYLGACAFLILSLPAIAAPARVTYEQVQKCVDLKAQPARQVGWIRVGDREVILMAGPTPAGKSCFWTTAQEGSRTVEHDVSSPFSSY